jgi:hypothetical protein
MESILNLIKKELGYEESDTGYDEEIITHINTVLMDLTQLGVGPPDGFEIEDDTSTWQDFLGDKVKKFNAVKTYIYMRVKLIFDSSTMSSTLIESYNKQCDRFEWRLTHAAESE